MASIRFADLGLAMLLRLAMSPCTSFTLHSNLILDKVNILDRRLSIGHFNSTWRHGSEGVSSSFGRSASPVSAARSAPYLPPPQ